MVKLEKHMKKFTAAALAGMVALALFTPGALAETDAVPADAEPALLSSDESAEEVTYNVKLAAWADDDNYQQNGTSYNVGKNFYVDVVVSGGSYSGFQGDVVYDSDKLIYDDTKTQEYVKGVYSTDNVLSIKEGGDGIVKVLRSGDVKSKAEVARIFFTARKDKLSEITMSNVKVGLDISDSSAALLPEDQITPCTLNITKSYIMVDPVIKSGDLDGNEEDGYNVDIDGTFAVDVISMNRTVDCAQLTVTYDDSMLEFIDNSEEVEGLKIDGSTAGRVIIIRTSDGMDSIARLWFKATSAGIASIDISEAKAGTLEAQTTYDAEDLAGCKITVNAPPAPPVQGVEVTLVDHIGDAAEYNGIAAGVNKLDGEFTFTVKSASTPVAAYTTDGGKTYTKIAATKAADAENTYSFTATAVEGMQIDAALLGDVNLDGMILADDVTKMSRDVAKIEFIPDGIARITADVTGDGQILADDVTKLSRYVAKIIDTLD